MNDLANLWSIPFLLDEQPATLRAGHRALDEDQAALDVGRNDLKLLLGAILVTHVAGHLLVLEDLARILALTGRTERAVRDRDAVGGAQTAEAPTLHAAGETLTLGATLDVDELAGDIVVGRDFGAHFEQAVRVDAELMDNRLGLDFGLAEVAALRLGDILRLGHARAELQRGIAILVLIADGDDLNAFERQNGDRHVAAVVLEQAGHPHFLRDHASAHDPLLLNRGTPGPIPRVLANPALRPSSGPARKMRSEPPSQAGCPANRT